MSGQILTFTDVDDYLSAVFAVSGTSCFNVEVCQNAYNGIIAPLEQEGFRDEVGTWRCRNMYYEPTTTGIDAVKPETTKTENAICLYDGCSTDTDCVGGEYCWNISHCDANNTFYDESFQLTSSICQRYDTCDDITFSQDINGDGGYTDELVCKISKLFSQKVVRFLVGVFEFSPKILCFLLKMPN